MSLTKEQLKAYEDSGLIFLPGYFSEAEVAIMKAEVPKVFAGSGPQKVMENGGRDVRSVYGAQFNSETFKRLTRHARIAKPAIALLGGDVYVYQFKINAKAAFGGDIWEWPKKARQNSRSIFNRFTGAELKVAWSIMNRFRAEPVSSHGKRRACARRWTTKIDSDRAVLKSLATLLSCREGNGRFHEPLHVIRLEIQDRK